MNLDRRAFLKFIGVGTVAGKLDFRSVRQEAQTELVVNNAGWQAARVFVKVTKPRRWGRVELYLLRGRPEPAEWKEALANAQLIGVLCANPRHEATVDMFDTSQAGFLGPEYRIVARTFADDDPEQPIGGELELEYQPYSAAVASRSDDAPLATIEKSYGPVTPARRRIHIG